MSTLTRPLLSRRHILAWACVLRVASAQKQDDPSGRWTGTMDMATPDGQLHKDPMEIELLRSKEGLSGLARLRDGKSLPFTECKLEQNQLTFTFALKTQVVLRFKGEIVEGKKIEGTTSFEMNGAVLEGVSAKVGLTKQ